MQVWQQKQQPSAPGVFGASNQLFAAFKGVTDAAVGYAGGKTENPTYDDVCTDETGHAEVVQVEFDPAVVSYEKLLDVFGAITIRPL